jgi:hypothetical protein
MQRLACLLACVGVALLVFSAFSRTQSVEFFTPPIPPPAVAQGFMAAAPVLPAEQLPATFVDGTMLAPVSSASTLIATQAGDFGGYTIPVIGLASLAAIIALLAGPVED